MRAMLYWLARVLGDFNAISSGKVGQRMFRRISGKMTAKGLGLFKF